MTTTYYFGKHKTTEKYILNMDFTDCLSTYIELTEAEWNKFAEEKAQGKIIIADSDGRPIVSQPEPYVWTSTERFVERKSIHTSTDGDYSKYSRTVRTGTTEQKAEAEIILAKIDAYNNAVSDTVNQTGFPQTVTYPDKTW